MKQGGYLDLFLTFARIGGFTFGGGYAMLPMLQREVVDNKNWASEEDLLDYYAIGQSTPGVIAVNVATFIGYRTKGVLGAICATLGVITPSFFIILIIASLLKNFADNIYVIRALNGIRVAVAALIVNAVITLWKKGVQGIIGVLIFSAVFLLCIFFPISPIWIVITAIIFGIAYGKLARSRESRGER